MCYVRLLLTGVTLFFAAALPQNERRTFCYTGGDYRQEALRILSSKCFTCHGPDEASRKARLRLDLRDEATKPLKSGRIAIKPGSTNESELLRRIFSKDASEVMPPPDSQHVLTDAERNVLRGWIATGAEYQEHWAFVKPVRPAIPEVVAKEWVRNDIDAFILHRLEKEGRKPAPTADRATLIRRLSFDLRGLPPSVAELDEFLADTSPKAYAKLVDRMLASPHYGEKMAQQWLDLARFGDTSGYQNDSARSMWLWRDEVIRAFNRNQSFDQFTLEQLAGDLFPGATLEQKIASGFNRNTRFNEEGGADPEESVVRYHVDRTNTLGQVWLGLTLGCAECHSHKYDPISHKEYYQLFAFFTGIAEPMKSGNHHQPLPPLVWKPSAEQTQYLAKRIQERKVIEQAIALELKRVAYKDPLAAKGEPINPVVRHEDVVWFDDELPRGAMVEGGWLWADAPQAPVKSGKKSTRRGGAGLQQQYFLGGDSPLPIFTSDKLFVYVWLDPKDPPRSIMLHWNDGDWEHRAYWGEDKCYMEGALNGPAHFHAGPLPEPGRWARLEIDAEKVGIKPGASVVGLAYSQFDGIVHYDTPGVSTLFPPDDRVNVSQRAWEVLERDNDTLPAEIHKALKTDAARRSEAQKQSLRDHYLRKVHAATREMLKPLEQEYEQLAKEIKQTEEAIPHTMVSEELATPRDAHVLLRGDFAMKAEKVGRATPAVLPAFPADAPRNRLGLARWLVAPDHPLTARVTVNRLWAQMFGTGLVRTVGDFGVQGEPPSHPELLDWLATEFIRSGWDVKAMLRTMALSATYQQSSSFNEAAKADPHNRILARASRHRLTAEEVRDNALAVAGLLNPKIGGPSFMPYQPPDFYKGKNESWPWIASTGDEQHRRGLYAFWRRTSLHPMFALFDAPSREDCCVERSRTNTPLQALTTLNDPTFVEAARVFAQRILSQGPDDLDGRIVFAFRCAVVRVPTLLEVNALKARYETQLARFQVDRDAASKLVNVGSHPRPANLDVAEHAAWTAIANLLLNLDETVTRE
jgi:hypothetical protein